MAKKNPENMTWLLFFYSVPSKPVSCRMRVWRRLAKAGAVQFKGAVYALPFSDEHYELLQWLASEVEAMNGEASFVKTGGVETAKDSELRALFSLQREKEYRNISGSLEEVERRLESMKKGAAALDLKKLTARFNKCSKEFDEVRRVDFFSSEAADAIRKRLEKAGHELKRISGIEAKTGTVTPRRTGDYQGRTWVTRKKPFVDRMASAWLIRKFIDSRAVFEFAGEKEIGKVGRSCVLFDAAGGEFTHAGTLCTFETLLASFGIKDKALKKIAEIVHDLDIRDGPPRNPESKGVEEILRGIAKTARSDEEALEKGMGVFEMVYASKTKP